MQENPTQSLYATTCRCTVELGESTSLDSRQGIILMPGSNCPQTSCRTFYSADYSVEAGRPAFVVEYTADTSLTNGYYFIRNGGCERYLDLVNGGSAVGTGTCIYNFHGRDNQLWYISLYNSSTGQYTIRPCNIGNRYLSAKNEYASPLTLSDTPCYWRLLRNGNGSYRILVDGSERQAAESASGSTENSAPVKTWGYGGAPNQKWVFEKATQLGGAGAYRQEDSERIKCLAYALESKPLPSIMVPDKDTVENFYERRIEPMVKSMGRQCRKLTSSSSYIRPNEYKIAMRIGINIPDEGGKNDMHFMVQTNTGGWAHKMGRNPSQYLGNINPTTYSWDYYRYNSDGEYTAYIVNGYDSPTLYFAVTR